MHEVVACPKCGSHYVKDKPWKRVCLDCYIESKSAQAEAADDAEVVRLRREVERLQAVIDLASFRKPTAASPGREVLSWLLQRSHPDKNAGSALAGEATRWLLGLR